MKFITVRELRGNTARLRRDLDDNQEIVVTANGKPFAVMTRVEPDSVEEELLAIRRARAQAALSRIRERAQSQGKDQMTSEQIDTVVTQVRDSRKQAS